MLREQGQEIIMIKELPHAKNALITFLKSISNPKDKVGLAVYNTNYTLYSGLTSDKARIEGYLDEIVQPKREEAFTEIYASVYSAVEEFSSVKGRKAIIVLSDGQNMPYYKYTRKPHKVFGQKIYQLFRADAILPGGRHFGVCNKFRAEK